MGIKIRVKHLKLEHLTKYEKELTQRGEKLARMCSPLFVSLSCGQRWSRPKYDDLVISTESIKLSDSRTGIIETWKWIKRRIFENSRLCVFVMEKKSCGWRQYILSCENLLYCFFGAFSCLRNFFAKYLVGCGKYFADCGKYSVGCGKCFAGCGLYVSG